MKAQSCWMLEDVECGRCGGDVATDGRLKWCLGRCRAELDSESPRRGGEWKPRKERFLDDVKKKGGES